MNKKVKIKVSGIIKSFCGSKSKTLPSSLKIKGSTNPRRRVKKPSINQLKSRPLNDLRPISLDRLWSPFTSPTNDAISK
jgi:hypothetical protein